MAPGIFDLKVKIVQYGVFSVKVGCQNPDENYPGVYTNVAYYMNWILNNMDPGSF